MCYGVISSTLQVREIESVSQLRSHLLQQLGEVILPALLMLVMNSFTSGFVGFLGFIGKVDVQMVEVRLPSVTNIPFRRFCKLQVYEV